MNSQDQELLTAIDIADLAMQKVVDLMRKRGDDRWGRLAAIQGEFCAPIRVKLVGQGEPVSVQQPVAIPGICQVCGRLKARSAEEAENGLCPKWWVIKDHAAGEDCVKAAKADCVRVAKSRND